MRVARDAGLHDDVGVAAQAGLYEVMMHSAGREQCVHGQLVALQVAIAEHQDQLAVTHGSLGLRTDLLQRRGQRQRRVDIQVDELVAVGVHVIAQQLAQFSLRQHGRIHDDLLRVLGADIEQARFATDICLQRHHDAFAQRVDRRIRDLRELLAEIVERRAHLLRQHRHRRVVAHRADRFLLGLRQHRDDVVQFLARQVEHLLVARKRLRVHRLGGHVRVDELGVEVAHAFLQPLAVRRARLEDVVDVVVVEQRAVDEIDGEHLAGAEAALCSARPFRRSRTRRLPTRS